MVWLVPTLITSFASPLTASILNDLLPASLCSTSRVTHVLLTNKNDSGQTGKVIWIFTHTETFIFDLTKCLPLFISPLTTCSPVAGHSTGSMGIEILVTTDILIPSIQSMSFFNI